MDSEFLDGSGKVIADGPLGEIERGGDLRDAGALHRGGQHLASACCIVVLLGDITAFVHIIGRACPIVYPLRRHCGGLPLKVTDPFA